jgi:hypothetical protein
MRRATGVERAHFTAVAEGERISEEERIERALGSTPGERVLTGFRLGAESPWTPAHLAEMDARTDEQMELARRRVALGLDARRAG